MEKDINVFKDHECKTNTSDHNNPKNDSMDRIIQFKFNKSNKTMRGQHIPRISAGSVEASVVKL